MTHRREPSVPLTAKKAQRALHALASPARARVSVRFFKTGPGQYGERDCFIGVAMPDIRGLAHRCSSLPFPETRQLLHSPIHEDRMLALLVLMGQYRTGDEKKREKIFRFYLKETKYINSWDLIDVTAEHIIGVHHGRRPSLLPQLARSKSIWERRISILSTFASIKRGDPKETMDIATILLQDSHDLIQKAVGWMLREMGKRCGEKPLHIFLTKHAHEMPRTMLRYAIERLPSQARKQWMSHS
jgi:3-methyladenine DNA glycosylase AlkD